MSVIRITCGGVSVTAELLPESAPDTIESLLSSLPISSSAKRWDDEVYFTVPIETDSENQCEVVETGDLAYWPPGEALCIFFGPTPASRGDEIRPVSPVNLIGRVHGNPRVFKDVNDGDRVVVERVE